MTVKQKLQDAQDDQRSKQLDLKEEGLNKREALLDDASRLSRIEVLDKQIIIREDLLEEAERKNKAYEQKIREKIEADTERFERLKERIDEKRNEIKKYETQLASITEVVRSTKNDLKQIREDISTQSIYRKQQQDTMDQTINEWNSQLKDFRDEGIEVQNHKDQVARDVLRLEQDKASIDKEVEVVNTKLLDLDEVYLEKATSYKEQLRVQREELQKGQQTLLEIEQKCKVRLEVIDTREKALDIRERVIQKSEFDLVSREKAVNMKVALSGVSLE